MVSVANCGEKIPSFKRGGRKELLEMLRCSNSSGFGDKSSVFNKKTKKLAHVQNSQRENIYWLEKLYEELLEILKDKDSTKNKAKKQIKTYLAQVEKANPVNPKRRWILMKIRGLLSYMLKKRQEFHCSLASGKITIYEKSLSQEIMNTDNSDSASVPSDFPTNNNFVTVSNEMECESNNYSEDTVGETDELLRNSSEENDSIPKSLTNANDEVFKIPSSVEKIEEDEQMHESEEKDYKPSNWLFSEENKFRENLFDDLKSNKQLKAEFVKVQEFVENWVIDLVDEVLHLKIRDSANTSAEISLLDDSTASTEGTAIKPWYNVENFITMREISTQMKENLKKMKENEQVEKIAKLIDSL